jgi:hypothetical protein
VIPVKENFPKRGGMGSLEKAESVKNQTKKRYKSPVIIRTQRVKEPKGEAILDFGRALVHLKEGERVSRKAWGGEWIQMFKPRSFSEMTLPFIFKRTVNGDSIPWFPVQEDILTEDWLLI